MSMSLTQLYTTANKTKSMRGELPSLHSYCPLLVLWFDEKLFGVFTWKQANHHPSLWGGGERRTDARPSLWVIVTLNMKISQLLIVGLWYFMRRWGWWVLNMNIFYKWTIWLLLNVKTVWRKKDVTCFDYYSAKGKTRADKTRRKRRTGKSEIWIGVKYTALALALCSRVKIR